MLTLYLVCLIVGGALVAMAIFGGGDFDADVDVAEAGGATEVGAAGTGVGGVARYITLRNAVFFAAFFGLTGTLFTLLGVGVLLTPFFAAAVGLVAAASVHHLMQFLGSEETGGLSEARQLAGAMAEVVVAIEEGRSGKIAVQGGGRTLQLVARVHEQAERRRFRPGDEVVVVGFDNGIAFVAGKAFLA